MENSKPTSDDRSLCIPPECKDARLVFQVRKGKYQVEQFHDEFSFCELRPRDRKSDFLLLRRTHR